MPFSRRGGGRQGNRPGSAMPTYTKLRFHASSWPFTSSRDNHRTTVPLGMEHLRGLARGFLQPADANCTAGSRKHEHVEHGLFFAACLLAGMEMEMEMDGFLFFGGHTYWPVPTNHTCSYWYYGHGLRSASAMITSIWGHRYTCDVTRMGH